MIQIMAKRKKKNNLLNTCKVKNSLVKNIQKNHRIRFGNNHNYNSKIIPFITLIWKQQHQLVFVTIIWYVIQNCS